MKKIIFGLFLLVKVLPAAAQPNAVPPKKTSPRPAISAELYLPLGDFSSTHLVGFGAGYLPGFKKNNDKISMNWQGGFALFTGKKETVSGYAYRYPLYLLLQAGAVLQYRIPDKLILEWMAGPGISRYDGSYRFLLNSKFSARYLISKKLSAGPLLYWIKESGAAALWNAGIRCAIFLQ